jgi:hypothetical protein
VTSPATPILQKQPMEKCSVRALARDHYFAKMPKKMAIIDLVEKILLIS